MKRTNHEAVCSIYYVKTYEWKY